VRIVGHRKERFLAYAASGTLLRAGALFNDEIHRLPSGDATFVPKGIYRFKTHDEANRQQTAWLAEGMARIALARR
jgi:hypothetical protein